MLKFNEKVESRTQLVIKTDFIWVWLRVVWAAARPAELF